MTTTKKKKKKRNPREQFNRLMGLRSAKNKDAHHKVKTPSWHRPIRVAPQGGFGLAQIGVAGWRQSYYRPHDVRLAPQEDVT